MIITLSPEEVKPLVNKLRDAISSLKTTDRGRVRRGREPEYADRIAFYEKLISKLEGKQPT